jgi:hypothetical protein
VGAKQDLTFVGFYIKLSGKIKIAHGKKKTLGLRVSEYQVDLIFRS